MKVYPNVTGALCANSHPGSYTGQDAFNNMLPVIEVSSNENVLRRKWTVGSDASTRNSKHTGLYARSKNYYGGGINMNEKNERKYVLRRLTPIECARLQGFPDWWCDGANGSDSAMYRLWGNGVALPCVAFIMDRIVNSERKQYEKEK